MAEIELLYAEGQWAEGKWWARIPEDWPQGPKTLGPFPTEGEAVGALHKRFFGYEECRCGHGGAYHHGAWSNGHCSECTCSQFRIKPLDVVRVEGDGDDGE